MSAVGPIEAEVLLVEDNPGDVHLFKQALEEAHCRAHVTSVPTVNEALSFLGKQGEYAGAPTPRLIVLDLNLPGVNGAVALNLIKATEDWRDIPVLVLSSSSRPSERDECRRMGAIDYWTKPAQWEDYLLMAENLATLLTQSRVARIADLASHKTVTHLLP